MVRLSETDGKRLLAERDVAVPEGDAAASPAEARSVAAAVGPPVVVKAQVPVTGRADRGLIAVAGTADEAEERAAGLFGRAVEGATVRSVRVEERLDVDDEWYAGVVIDAERRSPRVIASTLGGTGVETLSADHPDRVVDRLVPVSRDLRGYEAYDLVRRLDVHGPRLRAVGDLVAALARVFRATDARSVEVNPIGVIGDDAIALDARVSIDDAAAPRHPELGIEVAREFGRDPTELERIAYRVEAGDYRGTFYFIQTERDVDAVAEGEGYVGFHGAGGGGSMMSLDAVTDAGLREPNYTDTSGNPPAAKVYKAARVILSQPGIEGYFYSGSGAASQEMYTTARGLMRAFADEELTVPAVLRLGGNAEAEAIDVVRAYADRMPGVVEAYGGDTSAAECAGRLRDLVESNRDDPDGLAELSRTDPLDPAEVPYDLDIDGDLGIDGLDAYRRELADRPAVRALREVPHKWGF